MPPTHFPLTTLKAECLFNFDFGFVADHFE